MKRIFLDMDGTLAKFNVRNALTRFDKEKGFFIKLGAYVGIETYDIQIDSNCYLLDDYTRNLTEWESLGGKGIKRITKVSDNSRKLWKGLELKELKNIIKVLKKC